MNEKKAPTIKGLVACEATLQSQVEQAAGGDMYFARGAVARSGLRGTPGTVGERGAMARERVGGA